MGAANSDPLPVPSPPCVLALFQEKEDTLESLVTTAVINVTALPCSPTEELAVADRKVALRSSLQGSPLAGVRMLLCRGRIP